MLKPKKRTKFYALFPIRAFSIVRNIRQAQNGILTRQKLRFFAIPTNANDPVFDDNIFAFSKQYVKKFNQPQMLSICTTCMFSYCVVAAVSKAALWRVHTYVMGCVRVCAAFFQF